MGSTAGMSWRSRAGRALTHPVVAAGILALVGLPLEPEGGLDRAWKVGLAMASGQDLAFGPGVATTFGPLGYLAVPLDLYRRQLVLGALFTLAVAFVLYLAVLKFLRTWLSPWGAVGVGVVVMLVASRLPTAEMGSAAVVLWSLWFLRREALRIATPIWVIATLSAGAAMLGLVKLNAAAVGLCVVVLAVMSPSRWVRLAVAAASAVATTIVGWLVTGQSLGDLPVWVRRSVELVLGYGAAMSGPITTWRYLLLALPLLAIVVVGSVQALRLWGRRGWGFVAVVVLSTWLVAKESYVRFDVYHAPLLMAFVVLLIVALPWSGQLIGVALGGVAFCLVVFVADIGGGTPRLVASRVDASVELARVSRAAVDTGYYEQRREVAARANGFPLAPQVLDALQGERVHTDPGDMGTIWSNGLVWGPAPVFPPYAAYTDHLDDLNADALADADGPTAVLSRTEAIDGRNPRWESPDYQVAMACHFEVVAEASPWQALRRADDLCGDAVALGSVTVRPGEPIDVPGPNDPNSIVVARIDVPSSLFDRAVSTVFRPVRVPRVVVDETSYYFVAGTAESDHIVRQPAEVDGRQLPVGPVDVQTLRFEGVRGPITVEFYEIPLG
jgi:hypothetical protein